VVAATAQASANTEQEIRRFVKEWEQAGVRDDKAWFERNYADTMVKTDQTGRVLYDKQEVAEFAPDPARQIETSSMDDLRIQTFGNVALATFNVTLKGKDKDGVFNVHTATTSVFVKRGGIWQVVAHQATNIAPAK
jgi:ketosteroid isomerase-like protein